MPYIIVVNQPGFLPEQEPYAVATLEEAREAAADEIGRSIDYATRPDGIAASHEDAVAMDAERLAKRDASELPESGGIIGPLPDGYVIDVQSVSWAELAKLANVPSGLVGATISAEAENAGNWQQHILDAYNAR